MGGFPTVPTVPTVLRTFQGLRTLCTVERTLLGALPHVTRNDVQYYSTTVQQPLTVVRPVVLPTEHSGTDRRG